MSNAETLRGLWTLAASLFREAENSFSDGHSLNFLWHSFIEICHCLQYDSSDAACVVKVNVKVNVVPVV
jgi:hypothetical protein